MTSKSLASSLNTLGCRAAQSTRVLGLWLTIVILILLVLGRETNVLNSFVLSEPETSVAKKEGAVSVEEENCNVILDRLDETFNQRRLSRQQVQETISDGMPAFRSELV